MRKMLLTPLIVCMVTLLPTLCMPACHPKRPIPASGTWIYTPTPDRIWTGYGNTFRYGHEVSTWTGTFDGTSYDVFTVVVHPELDLNVEGLINFNGTVNGKSGFLVIRFDGKKPAGENWYGQWVILSGEGDLANLCGQGTWWGPGYPDPKGLEYSGRIRFD